VISQLAELLLVVHDAASLARSTISAYIRAADSTIDVTRWDEKAGLRRDAVRSQVIDVLEAQEIKETGNEGD
jgi:hypothetical protein